MPHALRHAVQGLHVLLTSATRFTQRKQPPMPSIGVIGKVPIRTKTSAMVLYSLSGADHNCFDLLFLKPLYMEYIMKKMIKNVAKSAIAIASLGVSGYGMAYDGTVNFKGSVVDSACTVNVATQSQSVDFGAVGKSGFTGDKSVTATKKFPITLDSCAVTTYKKVTVRFDGTQDGDNLKLTAGGATGLAVQLLNPDGTPLAMGTDSAVNDLSTGSNSINFGARYIQNAATVTTGAANAQAQFTLSYQ